MTIIPNIPVIYPDKFPKDFVNDIEGWGNFSQQELAQNKGKLLMLDIDFGNFCSLNCPHCFRRNDRINIGENRIMDYDQLLQLVKDAKKLGLKMVKFLGMGEPLQNIRFLEFLRELKKLDIIPTIFTKGHVIGDDQEVRKWYSHYGITTGEELVEELKKVNASILLGFNSFDAEIQERMVGGVQGHTIKRNRTLELLVKAGFNKNNPTKLGLAALPITNENYEEILKIYEWGRARNLYVVTCPTVSSGPCAQEQFQKKITPDKDKLIDLYVKIYKFNLNRGIQTMEQLEREGISQYPGAHPCNQIGCGMFVSLTGKILRCPGDDITTFGNIWEDTLENIWVKSENYKRAGTFNCGCPPRTGKTIPAELFKKVLEKLKNKDEKSGRETKVVI